MISACAINQISELITKGLESHWGVETAAAINVAELVEFPKDRKMGDFAFPCFRLAKNLKLAPPKIAVALQEALDPFLSQFDLVEKAVVAGPYLNFFLDYSGLARMVWTSLGNASFFDLGKKERKVMVEYSQPNTHKAFHVGHVRNVALGDALVRILEACGHEVVAANYIGDVGAHIAKCLWYYLNHRSQEVPTHGRGEFLGQLYTEATRLLDFTTLTRCPLPGVRAAKVLTYEPHPQQDDWCVLTLDTGDGAVVVVCGTRDVQVDDVVAYAAVGARYKGKVVQPVDKKGVESHGFILSDKELGIGPKNDVYRFPLGTALGVEVANFFQFPDVLPVGQDALDEMATRESGVRSVLQRLEKGDPEITAVWQETRQWSLDEFDEIYRYLDARFDHFFYESGVGDEGKRIVQEFYQKGVFVQSHGAIGADLTEAGMPFFMLLKSDGTGLYATKDLALAKEKFEKFKIDHSIYVVDYAQSLHFQQLFKTLEMMGFEQAGDCFHLAYGQVVLPEGKMSSRVGNIILFSQLKESLEEKIYTDFLAKYEGQWPADEIDMAKRRIALATIKYGMLNQDNVKNIVFDLGEWTAQTGNTGPYMLYAYARIASIFRDAGAVDLSSVDWSLLVHPNERELAFKVSRFPDALVRAAAEHKPQVLCTYLYELAKEFSRMYDNCSVLKADSEALKMMRLALIQTGGQVLKYGLGLLGIQVLDRM